MTIYAIHNAEGVIFQTIDQFDELVSEGGLLASPISDAWRRKNPHDFYYDTSIGDAAASVAIPIILDKTSILDDGINAATVSGLPDPCHLIVDNELIKVIGGSYSFAKVGQGQIIFRAVGRYRSDITIITAYDLTTLKSEVADRIDAAAETSRLKYITGGSGQAMVYQAKADEAKAYTATPSPVDGDYPILLSEATATGATVAALAASVLAVTGQWVALAAQIEGLRMGGKKLLKAALTVEDALAAAQINWP